jgi:hypothetical protein
VDVAAPQGVHFKATLASDQVSYPKSRRGSNQLRQRRPFHSAHVASEVQAPLIQRMAAKTNLDRDIISMDEHESAVPPQEDVSDARFDYTQKNTEKQLVSASDPKRLVPPSNLGSVVLHNGIVESEPMDKLYLLDKAEKLLNAVKKTLQKNTKVENTTSGLYGAENSESLKVSSPVLESVSISENQYHKVTPSSRSMGLDVLHPISTPGGDIIGIDWLLRDVPEVFSAQDDIEDEVVEKLLKQGGNPPSQLRLPSFYSHSQRQLEQLLCMKHLKITLSSLRIFSARFGFRKAKSYVVVTPPAGIQYSDAKLSKIRIDLPELADPMILANRAKTRKSVNVLHDFFVGDIDFSCNKSVIWDVVFTDEIVKVWLESQHLGNGKSSQNGGTQQGCIRLEFYSPLRSADEVYRYKVDMKKSVDLRLGYIDIPLCGLLNCSQNFDVILSSDISTDLESHQIVKSRLERLPTGIRKLNDAVNARENEYAPKLGSISARIQLLGDSNDVSRREKAPRTHSVPLLNNDSSSFKSDYDFGVTIEDNLHQALQYVPSELSRSSSAFVSDDACFVGIILHCIALDVQLANSILMSDVSPPNIGDSIELRAEYKIQLETGR